MATSDSPASLATVTGRRWIVHTGQSQLRVLVYRGGPMARLGHNHVIASHALTGEVVLGETFTASAFDLRIPVTEFTVDEPALRAAAGSDFPVNVPPDARAGTRRNLLSAALLDGAHYPTIRLRSVDIVPAGEGYEVGVAVTLKDQQRLVRVPVQLQVEPNQLLARGDFRLKQSDLGLQPFSAAMGALVVLDEMRIQFEITARPAAVISSAP